MIRSSSKLMAILAMALFLPLTVAACGPSQEEFDQLKTQHDALKTRFDALQSDLISWSNSVQAWQTNSYHVICDIVENNPQSGYAQQTRDYCPTEGGGDGSGLPDNPPDFGGS